MASSRPAQNIFWSFITSLVDGEKVNKVRLYDEAIHRLQDSTFFVLGKVAEALQLLQSVDVGTAASITGSVNLTTFDFAAGATLSGLTLSIDEDTALPQVVTFPNTITSIPLLLNELATQAATNLEFEITDAGLLVARSGTLGAGSTMATITGTAALALFGTQTSVAGSGLVNDGALRIGLGAISGTPWAGGTLRDFITNTLLPAIAADNDALQIGNGGTLGAGDQTILVGALTTLRMHFVVPAPVADANITLPAVVTGQVIRFRMNPNPPFNVFIKRPDTTIIAKLSGTIGATTAQQWVEIAALGGVWVVVGFGNSDDNQTLV